MSLHPIFETILTSWQSASSTSQLPSVAKPQTLKNNVIHAGTPVAKQRGMKKRQHWFGEQCCVVEYHGQNRATFECKAVGHRFKRQMLPPAPNGKFPSEALLGKFARYWSQHVNMACPKCHASCKS